MDANQFNAALSKAVRSALLRLPSAVGNEAALFALDNFRNQSWAGEAWPKRKNPTRWGKVRRPGRSLLVDTGALRRSVRITRLDADAVWIGSSLPYAKAHHEGFAGDVVQSVKGHTRNGISKVSAVRAHTRTVRQRIPKRQFMGAHPMLAKRLISAIEAEILKELQTISHSLL